MTGLTRFRDPKCATCGHRFFYEVTPGRPRLLCDGCQYYKGRRGHYEGVCPCGTSFTGARSGVPQMYCSSRCKRRAQAVAKYGITLADYHRLLTTQDGGCAICGAGETEESLYVDHCHSTGRVRGLLCPHCNFGIGHFRDSTSLLSSAIHYLTEPIEEP